MSRQLEAAIAAAGRGWRVFPLKPNAKTPAIVGWNDAATTDLDRIRRWWTRPEHAADGVAIACGPSGLLVIDCDRPKPGEQPSQPGVRDGFDALALAAERAGDSLPVDTHTVKTGSGGLHLYYCQPDSAPLGNSQGRLGCLVDTRGRGGYVVAAGTVINDRPYRVVRNAAVLPLPSWTVALLAPARRDVIATAQVRTDRLTGYLAAAVDAEMRNVTTAESGRHNSALYIAAINLGRLIAGGSLEEPVAYHALMSAEQTLAANCHKADHTAQRAHKTIMSGFRAGSQRPRKVAA